MSRALARVAEPSSPGKLYWNFCIFTIIQSASRRNAVLIKNRVAYPITSNTISIRVKNVVKAPRFASANSMPSCCRDPPSHLGGYEAIFHRLGMPLPVESGRDEITPALPPYLLRRHLFLLRRQ